VQGDRGLSGTRAALDDQNAGEGGPDDLVLLPLDRGDDVAHPAGAGPLERADEDLGPGQTQAATGVVPLGVEELVLEVQHLGAVREEVASQLQAHRVGTGRPVERLGDGGPPVDDQRFLIRVRDGQPTDMELVGRILGRSGSLIDPPEHQRLAAELQMLEPAQAVADPDVPLGDRLERPPSLPERVLKHRLGRRPHGGEPLVRQIHVSLFGREVGMGHIGKHPLCVVSAPIASHPARSASPGRAQPAASMLPFGTSMIQDGKWASPVT
jgi:hypothetical protein